MVNPPADFSTMTDDEVFDTLHYAAKKVSYYEAAESSYSSERAARLEAKTLFNRACKEADERGIKYTLKGYLL